VARARILHVIPPLARRGVRDTLELGALDAMTSGALAATGRRATAIDLKSGRLDPRARDAGVRFEVMNAEKLGFDDGSFDLVLSHNAFEHFHHPDLVLEEALRVVRPGGFVYLDFGPLYLSPWGLHEYQSITVPYCHLLFPLDVLSRFARDRGLPALDPSDVNGWPLIRYRALWRRVAPRARILHHHERRLLAHLDLITAHPSCFRSDTDSFADLVVSNIEVLFRRA
jgi:SAM-dependent methyltransferase